ncbi:MAG: Maf family protein [candidate division Zixibacteria bacterium]
MTNLREIKTGTAMKIVLASGSPRRQKLLSEMGYDFEVVTPVIPEKNTPGEAPQDFVKRLSRLKAESVALKYPDSLIVGADTVVVLERRILGKPESKSEAKSMLELLSGKTHTVFTGLSMIVLEKDITTSDFDSTEVTFNKLSPEDINRYVESGEPLDKAGAYGIQGMGSFLVDNYDGELDTVIGFPSKLFKTMYEGVLSCPEL